ncbi:hypothetical protein KC347_g258 [Hortaea werneckii]|nr:hypothetical protein KC347_g258 [Hortaea werneckii]
MSATLFYQLGALSKSGSAQRVTFADQTARGIDNPLATPERIDDDHLVSTEAIVQLDHLHIFDVDLGLSWSFKCGRASKKSWLTNTAAAPPSEVGQHCSFVRGSWIIVAFMTSKSSSLAPYFSMYSRPALPNIWAAPGAFVMPRVARIISAVVPVGLARSLKKDCRLPGNIFSKPTTSTASAMPPEIIIGIWVMPNW